MFQTSVTVHHFRTLD